MVFYLKTYLNYKYISNEEALKSSSAAGSPVTVMDNVQISDFVDLFFSHFSFKNLGHTSSVNILT